jgi:hypothetical protein
VLLRIFLTLSVLDIGARADNVYIRAIATLRGVPVDPGRFPHTVDGFAGYLRAVGVRSVSAEDLTTPNHPDVAARLGFTAFLPERNWWPRGAALALVAQRVRELTGEQVRIRNWWRPQTYNLDPVVGGARNGDHPTANAIDIDFHSRGARVLAEQWLRSLARKNPWLGISLGLGDRTAHVGIGSPKGKREWHYAGWRQF